MFKAAAAAVVSAGVGGAVTSLLSGWVGPQAEAAGLLMAGLSLFLASWAVRGHADTEAGSLIGPAAKAS